MGRGKSEVNEYYYLVAMNSTENKLERISTSEIEDREIGNGLILSSNDNPEDKIIKEDLYRKLSAEAKEVIDIILNSPAEVIKIISAPKHNRIMKNRVKDFFRFRWKSEFITDSVIKEISEWVKTFK